MLNAGKLGVVEKSVDVTLAASNQLLTARRSQAQKVAVISQHRFDTSTRIVRDAVEQRRLGRLTVGTAQVRHQRTQSFL